MSEIMIAVRQGHIRIDGRRYIVRRGVTTAHRDHPIVRDHPNLWEPIKIDYPMPDGAGSVGAGTPSGEPDNAVVRAWATGAGIPVAPYGKVPSAVIEAYRAAHAAP
ncbi:MAG TPA: hypothetical protein VFC00_25100 [Micromonosporaceae bacterium]|nr:hypothetical protein [Micromonosporaceae bacterium]